MDAATITSKTESSVFPALVKYINKDNYAVAFCEGNKLFIVASYVELLQEYLDAVDLQLSDYYEVERIK